MIYVFVGKAASGKDSIVRGLVDMGYKKIISHTTRPMRAGEKNGVDYWFEDNIKSDNAICLKSYTVADGSVWNYWFDKNEIMSAIKSDEIYLCIADQDGAFELEKFGAEIIYIYVPLKERLRRYWIRESKNNNPDYNEVIRRVLADEDDMVIIEHKAYHEGWYSDITNNYISIEEAIERARLIIERGS